jgi:predicted RNA-binding Zn-ribbon protein involved in translation (DUF1610 family)
MTDSIVNNKYQCPACGEKEYILETVVEQKVTKITCMSCGYDASMQNFITL